MNVAQLQGLKDSNPTEWARAERRRQKLQQRLDAQLGVAKVAEPSRHKAEIFYVHADE